MNLGLHKLTNIGSIHIFSDIVILPVTNSPQSSQNDTDKGSSSKHIFLY